MKRIIALILTVFMLSTVFVGCGEDEKQNVGGITDGGTAGGGGEKNESGSDKDDAVSVTFGNSVNNLFQSSKTLAFGDGRVFYVDNDANLCSFKEDGSDFKIHGAAGEDYSINSFRYLNYYKGDIYYYSYEIGKDDEAFEAVRKFDLESGSFTDFAKLDNRGSNGMVIINDIAFVSTCAIDRKSSTTKIYAVDLINGNVKTLMESRAKCTVGSTAFDCDGKYVYMLLNDTDGGSFYRAKLSDIMNEEEPFEEVFGNLRMTWFGATIFDNGGVYLAKAEGSGSQRKTRYSFYNYSDIKDGRISDDSEKWSCATDYGYPESAVEYKTEADEIHSLGYDNTVFSFMLGNRRLSIKTGTAFGEFLNKWRVFMSNNELWADSVKTATIEYPKVSTLGVSSLYCGEYNDKIYVVELSTNTLHYIDASGTYN